MPFSPARSARAGANGRRGVKTQSPDAIEALEPFHTAELIKPV
jgi:hypothetical protein